MPHKTPFMLLFLFLLCCRAYSKNSINVQELNNFSYEIYTANESVISSQLPRDLNIKSNYSKLPPNVYTDSEIIYSIWDSSSVSYMFTKNNLLKYTSGILGYNITINEIRIITLGGNNIYLVNGLGTSSNLNIISKTTGSILSTVNLNTFTGVSGAWDSYVSADFFNSKYYLNLGALSQDRVISKVNITSGVLTLEKIYISSCLRSYNKMFIVRSTNSIIVGCNFDFTFNKINLTDDVITSNSVIITSMLYSTFDSNNDDVYIRTATGISIYNLNTGIRIDSSEIIASTTPLYSSNPIFITSSGIYITYGNTLYKYEKNLNYMYSMNVGSGVLNIVDNPTGKDLIILANNNYIVTDKIFHYISGKIETNSIGLYEISNITNLNVTNAITCDNSIFNKRVSKINTFYRYRFTECSHSKDSFLYFKVDGILPDGIVFDGFSGTLSGTPTEISKTTLTVTVSDFDRLTVIDRKFNGASKIINITFLVNYGPSVTKNYANVLSVQNYNTPIVLENSNFYSRDNLKLEVKVITKPDWVMVDYKNNITVLNGTPGVFDSDTKIVVQSRDENGQSINSEFTIAVKPELQPVSNQIINDQILQINTEFYLRLPASICVDTFDKTIKYNFESTLIDGDTLPYWLFFDPVNIQYKAVPPREATGFYEFGVYEIKLTCRGVNAERSFIFKFFVGGMSTGQLVLTVMGPSISFICAGLGLYAKRYFIWNHFFSSRFQKETIICDDDETYTQSLLIHEDEIDAFKVLDLNGKDIAKGLSIVNLNYDHLSNSLIVKSLNEITDSGIVIRAIDHGFFFREEYTFIRKKYIDEEVKEFEGSGDEMESVKVDSAEIETINSKTNLPNEILDPENGNQDS
jgi:hypothetical protein